MFLFIVMVEFRMLELMKGRLVMCSRFCSDLFLFSVLCMIGNIMLICFSMVVGVVGISCCCDWLGSIVMVWLEVCSVMCDGLLVFSRNCCGLLMCYWFCLLMLIRVMLKCFLFSVLMMFFVDCSEILCLVECLLKMILIWVLFIVVLFLVC